MVEYYSCPLLFIPGSVNEYLARRRHLEKYPHTAPAYDDQNPRYVAFDNYYSAKLAEFSESKKLGMMD